MNAEWRLFWLAVGSALAAIASALEDAAVAVADAVGALFEE